jgi:hypothetical protein
VEIHSNLTETLGTEAVSYSTITRYLHKTNITDLIEVEENQDRHSSFFEINEAILMALDDELFSSLNDLTRHTYLFKTRIQSHFTCSCGRAI